MNVDLSQYQIIASSIIRDNKASFIRANIPFMRINREGKIVPIPIKDIDMVLNSPKAMNIYINKDYQKYIASIVNIKKTKEKLNPAMEAEKDSLERMLKFQKMSLGEKIDRISNHSRKMTEALKEKTITKTVAHDMIESQTDASLILKSTVFQNFKQVKNNDKTFEKIQNENRELMKVTKNLVISIVKILSKNPETSDVFSNLKHYSEGGTAAHSNRVFVMFTDFIRFYNTQTNENSFFVKMRRQFSEEYSQFYQNIINKYNDYKTITILEDAIESGLGRLNENELLNLPVAALLHDIGKVKDIDYFEGENTRDIDRIQRHLFNSYYLVTKMIELPKEISLTIGFHHEYNGFGYGPFKTLYEKNKVKDPRFRIPYVLTYSADSISNCNAIGYFPAKVLEIVDVYDALIDPARKYRKGKIFTKEEALTLMEDDFIVKHTKLDPILFHIFKEYIMSKKTDAILNI